MSRRHNRGGTDTYHVLTFGDHRIVVELQHGVIRKIQCCDNSTRTGWRTLIETPPPGWNISIPTQDGNGSRPIGPNGYPADIIIRGIVTHLRIPHGDHSAVADADKIEATEMFLVALNPDLEHNMVLTGLAAHADTHTIHTTHPDRPQP